MGGGYWAKEHFLVLTTKNGPCAGLRGVGLGSNLKKRRRAATLALAVTAAVHGGLDNTAGDSAKNRAEMVELVKLAKRAQDDMMPDWQQEKLQNKLSLSEKYF